MAGIALKRSSKLSGIPTHIHTLDKRMGGLQCSDLIVLAGRPGMGKTSLATNIAFNIAMACKAEHNPGNVEKNEGGVVGFFSLEMSSEQLATRIIAEQADISSSRIRRGDITEDDFFRLMHKIQKMQQIPLYIDQTGGLSIAQLTARARRLKRQRNLDVLIIDYVQLMNASSQRASGTLYFLFTEMNTILKTVSP